MKYLFWILMLFAAAVAVTIASHNPADVLILYPPYRISLSLMLFVGLLLMTFGLGYGLIRFIAMTLQLPVYVRNFRESRVRTKGRAMLDEALHAFFEGRYATAEKSAATAIELGETDPLYPILAARAAHELREYAKRDAYLSTADEHNVMRLMAAAEFMLDQRQPQSALNVLQTLRDSGVKNHGGALKLELKAHQQARNWAGVLSLLEQLEKRVAIDPVTAEQLRQQAHLESIAQQSDMAGLTACLKAMPVEFKLRSKIAAAAARSLIRLGGCALTPQLLAESLNRQWESELVTLYGECQSGDVLAQIEQAEQWLLQHKADAQLLLTLGKLCSYQQLWGKARTYLDASISIEPSSAAYTALAQLAERLGQPSFPYYQQALKLGERV
ncbi:MAG: heme biosynthesis HemY N-terminal domain-containing protein [Gallionella sp.]|nr:heme biosynthesis HemY N-terminal domain-containing protein [Gallionella sp.]